jgi:hypothetical protein
VLLVDRSTCTGSRAGATICPTDSALLIARYLLEELTASRLIRPIMLILQVSFFGSR